MVIGMSAKKWALFLAALFLIAVITTLVLYRRFPMDIVGVYCDGELMYLIDPNVDGEYKVNNLGINIVTVQNGRIYISEADCPDGVCVRHGALRKNDAIICVPNKVVVRKVKSGGVDGVTGKSS